MDVSWHDADLGLPRRDKSWTIRADQPAMAFIQSFFDLDHVQHRNPLGDADDQVNAVGDIFQHRVFGKFSGNINDRRIGAGRFFRFFDAVKYRYPLNALSALARRDPADDLCAVFLHLFGME